jgi:hypothetical protein
MNFITDTFNVIKMPAPIPFLKEIPTAPVYMLHPHGTDVPDGLNQKDSIPASQLVGPAIILYRPDLALDEQGGKVDLIPCLTCFTVGAGKTISDDPPNPDEITKLLLSDLGMETCAMAMISTLKRRSFADDVSDLLGDDTDGADVVVRVLRNLLCIAKMVNMCYRKRDTQTLKTDLPGVVASASSSVAFH